jgi:23S rRNA (cytidine1920-2'-O)/16S rRNA (cytidine1409-2'-O)-methyltransferase
MKKTRLDMLLVEQGLVESRSIAQRLVMAGQVRVNGEVVLQVAKQVLPDVTLTVDAGPRFVSRGGDKLEAALQAFTLDIHAQICADVGASTGGFTDCLLKHGALKVYAIDVGKGVLDWKLRQDPRVVALEGTNARFLEHLPEDVGVITIDVSFISLKVILPAVKTWFSHSVPSKGVIIALIKPQFEAGRQLVSRGKGVVRDPAIHHQVLLDVLSFARSEGFVTSGLIRSPIHGPKGNVEFLAHLEISNDQAIPLDALVAAVLPPP